MDNLASFQPCADNSADSERNVNVFPSEVELCLLISAIILKSELTAGHSTFPKGNLGKECKSRPQI